MATLVCATVAGTVSARADDEVPLGPSCPALYVLGVQGPAESAPDTGATTDTGALGQMFASLNSAAQGLVQRLYIPYGRSDTGADEPYEQAITTAATRLESTATEIVHRCPATKIAIAGYTQGAPAVSAFARRVGAGASAVGADQVAAIALIANPARGQNTAILPGRPGESTPSSAPGTSGAQVSRVTLLDSKPSGGGIAQNSTTPAEFGSLAGRVADFCATGDVTCDVAPAGPIATAVGNIAARTDLRDPVAAISTVAESLAATVYKTAVGVVNEDIQGNSLDQLSYQPSTSISQRLADASDPATPLPGPDQALAALFKIGTIGLGAVVSVARRVLTPQTFAELATVGLADPLAALAVLGTKIAAAAVELVPPQTASRWVNEAFDAVTSEIKDNTQLYELSSQTRYSDTDGRHSSYTNLPAAATGRSALATTADWFAAAAHDLAATTPTRSAPVSGTPRVTSPAPTASSERPTSAATPTTPTPGGLPAP
ncbi:cutinase family protein [Nocardia sp. CA-128927]|uniref:cutinase family protein n=1 Tax=Nocardia sp. CA-128927 TaxID=3239975 RepID=UPI003D9558AF